MSTNKTMTPIFSEEHGGMWIMSEKIPGETGNWERHWYTKVDACDTGRFAEMAAQLRATADFLEAMDKAGVTIEDSTSDGHATFQTTDPAVAQMFDFEWMPYEFTKSGRLRYDDEEEEPVKVLN